MRISRKILSISLALLTSSLLPSVALAQGAAVQNRDWSVLKTVTSGTKLVTKLKSGKTVEGRLTGVSDTALSMTVKDKLLDLNRDDILRVYQASSKSASKATLIGLAAGAGTGAAIGAAGSDGFFVKKSAGAGVFGILGAGVGALVGFAVGKSGHKRALIYEAK